MSDNLKNAIHLLNSTDALVEHLEGEFKRANIKIEDEKVREALDILSRLSWARHASSCMFTEMCAKLSDLVDDHISEVLLPIKEKLDEERKYLEGKK